MSEPKDHSQSGSEQGGYEPRGAERFWGDYARQSRPGRHEEPAGTGAGERASGGAGERGFDPLAGNGRASARERLLGSEHECLEWCPICRTADVLRTNAPPEIREQLSSLQRDTLVTLRQLLDAYIDRLGDQPGRSARRVEDIPIE